ncbi:MAG TPA: phosphatidylglycerol lysyltransferase domain-containing protein [Bryobacteraceae bacterium]|nr:phosphatidylglycerol lysyltransferase domain-containing protein [Bryobacteraceae bacterium]
MRKCRVALPETDSPPPARSAAPSPIKRLATAVAIAVAGGSGILNLLSLLGGPAPAENPRWLWKVLPFDFVGLSRSLTLLLGFILILTALHLSSGKRRALQLAIGLAGTSGILHLIRMELPELLSSSAIIALLLWARDLFTAGSARPALLPAVRRALIALAVPFLYGVGGFWLLEPHEFGKNFHWWDAIERTARLLAFLDDKTLLPKTAYAAWFLDSITLILLASFLYACLILFRPAAYHFRLNPVEQDRAAAIAEDYGRSAQDYFKHYPDKSYFFSKSGRAFIAYRVAGNFAVALGDPVGPEHELPEIVEDFAGYCRERGWGVAFHQVFPDRLSMYRALGFRRLKIGDDALVDLHSFSLSGSAAKEFRNTVNRLKRYGYRVERFDAPIDRERMEELKNVSEAWLKLPGHRERRFTLGKFDRDYVRSTTVYAALDGHGHVAAFLNLVPSYCRGLATVDLMRRHPNSPNGIMDFLFTEVFLNLKAHGYAQFSLGMVPLAQLGESEGLTTVERLLRWLLKRAPWLFRTGTLQRFKAKYASRWEARYSVYRNPLDLPKLALALRRVSELEHIKEPA